jgi:hypothetical protein
VLPTRGTPTAAVASPAPSLTTAQIAADAVAFVKRYYAEINHAIATGDTAELRKMQKPTCACTRLVNAIEDSWVANRLVAGEVLTPERFDPRDVFPAVASVTVVYASRGYQIIPRDGGVAHRAPTHSRVVEEVEISKEGSAWVVSDVRQLSS